MENDSHQIVESNLPVKAELQLAVLTPPSLLLGEKVREDRNSEQERRHCILFLDFLPFAG